MSDDEVDYDETAHEEWDSGPFCRHWSDPADCEEVCATCGHGCGRHRGGDDECQEYGCDCKAWKDRP